MYSIKENPPGHVQETLKTYDALTQRLLYTRGITTESDASAFLQKSWENTDPYQYSSMQKAAERLLTAIKQNEKIGIYSDYDCDGIPAAAALYTTLKAFGHQQIVHYVPERNEEGFGISTKGIQHLIDHAVTVVCVLDCGTSDPDGIEKLRQEGIDVIIIDHHLPGTTVPSAFAILNPVLEEAVPEPYPCAAGVTYLFIQALIIQAQDSTIKHKPKPGWEKWQLDIVGMATLSDMVPLRGINRQMVHFGLQVIRKSPRPGIQALCDEVGVKQQKVTQDDITFLMVPRINAASRMGDARIALTLLTSETIEQAKECAAHLTKLNNKRKTTVAAMVRKAHTQAAAKSKDKAVWVFGDRGWKPSLAGLVAQKLVETYNKTVFVWGQGGDSDTPAIKGSCRSQQHNVFTLMQKETDLFIEAGGHAQAGGFTLKEAKEVVLEDQLNTAATETDEVVKEIIVDSECTAREVKNILRLCDQFAPFGSENDRVLVAIPNCTVQKSIWFGKKKEHIRYVFADSTGTIEGITFFAEKERVDAIGKRQSVRTVVGPVEWDSFQGRPRIRVQHIL